MGFSTRHWRKYWRKNQRVEQQPATLLCRGKEQRRWKLQQEYIAWFPKWHRKVFKQPALQGIHIATDPAFQQSNQMLNAKLKNMKQQGEENVKHKPCIENEDLRRLKESASCYEPLNASGSSEQRVVSHNPLLLPSGTWRAKKPEEKQLCFSPKRKRKALRDNGARRGK